MRRGAGPGLTRDDHLEISGAALRHRRPRAPGSPTSPRSSARTRSRPPTAPTCGSRPPSSRDFLSQAPDESRSLEETLDRAWAVASLLPRERAVDDQPPATLDAHYRAPMPLRIPPGRAGRIWLVGRLEVARRGADLLDRKRQALLREQARVRAEADEARRAWHDAVAEAERWTRARHAARRATAARPARPTRRRATASLELSWSNLMGAQLPSPAGDRRARPAAAVRARRKLGHRARRARVLRGDPRRRPPRRGRARRRRSSPPSSPARPGGCARSRPAGYPGTRLRSRSSTSPSTRTSAGRPHACAGSPVAGPRSGEAAPDELATRVEVD